MPPPFRLRPRANIEAHDYEYDNKEVSSSAPPPSAGAANRCGVSWWRSCERGSSSETERGSCRQCQAGCWSEGRGSRGRRGGGRRAAWTGGPRGRRGLVVRRPPLPDAFEERGGWRIGNEAVGQNPTGLQFRKGDTQEQHSESRHDTTAVPQKTTADTNPPNQKSQPKKPKKHFANCGKNFIFSSEFQTDNPNHSLPLLLLRSNFLIGF